MNAKLHVDGQVRFNRTVGSAFVLSSGENIYENRRVAALDLSDNTAILLVWVRTSVRREVRRSQQFLRTLFKNAWAVRPPARGG